jgi:subtilisin family serine protease
MILRLLLIAGLASMLLPDLAAEPPAGQATIAPSVWQALQWQDETEILVVLRAQANLSGASALSTKEAKGRYVYDRLRAVAESSQKGLRAWLDAQGVEYQSFYLVNAIKVQVDRGRLLSMAARPDVDRIVPNPWVKGVPAEPMEAQAEVCGQLRIEPNLVRVHADDVWALGYRGQGIVVAGQDTGYDWDHPVLMAQYRGWDGAAVEHDYNWHDAVHSGGGLCGADSAEPCDDHGHGTHTMGTMVGDDGNGHQVGMAPDARWIGCRNMDEGYGTPATYIECFEFFLAPYPVDGLPDEGEPSLAPDVVNNSWICPPDEGCDLGTLEAAVEAVLQAGIVVVVSAGNSGYSGCGSVDNPPAIYRQSFTVANYDHRTDQISGSSSRGPVTYGAESYTKPDIAAPGTGICSSTRNSSYGSLSGTSMAAPHVSGAVALLLSAAPQYRGQVDTIQQFLTYGAEPKRDAQCGDRGPPNNVWGWGILDMQHAVASALPGRIWYLPLIVHSSL